VWVDVARHDQRLEIAVRDRGLGIPHDEQRRIFDKFVRGSTARDVRGTGVGLAMARQIVVAHGGEITVVSEPGQGSTFTIVLPASSTNR
jgi:signal transduction histidine kinase